MGVQLYRKNHRHYWPGPNWRAVAQRSQAFGMNVIAYDPYLTDEVAEQLKVERVELSELFARADFISLHATSTPDTQHIINATPLPR